jgi:hypothetical protein
MSNMGSWINLNVDETKGWEQAQTLSSTGHYVQNSNGNYIIYGSAGIPSGWTTTTIPYVGTTSTSTPIMDPEVLKEEIRQQLREEVRNEIKRELGLTGLKKDCDGILAKGRKFREN